MLVVSRNVGQRIKIGDDVWITLVESRSGRARLGIIAPREVPVFREELLDRREKGNEEEKNQ